MLLSLSCTAGINLCDTDADCHGTALCDVPHGVCIQVPADDAGLGGGAALDDDAGLGGGTTSSLGGGGGGAGGPLTLTLIVPAPASKPASNGTTYDDAPLAFRRDADLFVWLSGDQALTQPQVQVTGTRGAAMSADPVDASNCAGTCPGSCACFRVQPFKVPLDAMRGSLSLVGVDGSSRSATVTAPITRLAWQRALGGEVHATPALGHDGMFYVGIAITGGMKKGAVVSLTPMGQPRWTWQLGEVRTSVAVSTDDRVYVGATEDNGVKLSVLRADDGNSVGDCSFDHMSSLTLAPALVSGHGVFFVGGRNELVNVSPGSCPMMGSKVTNVDTTGGVTAQGTTIYLAGGGFLHRYDANNDKWEERKQGQWPLGLLGFTPRSIAMWRADKLHLVGDALGGSTLLRVSVGNNVSLDWALYPLRLANRSANPHVTAGDGVAWLGTNNALAAVSTTAATFASAELKVAPVLAEGARTYTLGADGNLTEWSRAGAAATQIWHAPMSTDSFEAAPVLDCSRDASGAARAGRPGVLYAATVKGQLTAVIVDARGLDTTAAWPSQLHDPTNSGNLDTPLSAFACP